MGALLVRDAIFEEFADVAPNLEEVLNMLGGQFTNEDMTDLTYAVDVEGRDLTEVAGKPWKPADFCNYTCFLLHLTHTRENPRKASSFRGFPVLQ